MPPKTPVEQFQMLSTSLASKIGSIVVHADEATRGGGHEFDLFALRSLLGDAEVVAWRKAGEKLALLPVMRKRGRG